MNAKQAVAKMNEHLKAAGFEFAGNISAEEFEDGVGAGIGANWIKGGVWYTEAQATKEIGRSFIKTETGMKFQTARAIYAVDKRNPADFEIV